MGRSLATAIATTAVALLVTACGEVRNTDLLVSPSCETGISVNGQGRVVAVPDIAVLTLGVEVTAPKVAAARSGAAAAMKAVRDSLDSNGIGRDDIKTLSFDIQPKQHFRRDEPPEITGYTVSNRVSVKVRDLDAVSEVLDGAAEAGGDAVRVSGIAFSIDKPETYESEARRAAVEDAHKRAAELAALAGVKLGRARSISEIGVSMPLPQPRYRGAMLESAAPPTPISPGEAEVSVSVAVVYEIE